MRSTEAARLQVLSARVRVCVCAKQALCSSYLKDKWSWRQAERQESSQGVGGGSRKEGIALPRPRDLYCFKRQPPEDEEMCLRTGGRSQASLQPLSSLSCPSLASSKPPFATPRCQQPAGCLDMEDAARFLCRRLSLPWTHWPFSWSVQGWKEEASDAKRGLQSRANWPLLLGEKPLLTRFPSGLQAPGSV